ncbi:bifunctional ADP-dependent NAD(P)H-hydrate dehydratase/NAD(P)H-hydrate epimerase [Bordetella genomosp. 8]|uniref:Bifunctional NAD(P)H-hydrate repair enzyme n=1 Tax=Bordetella genomosp. 8 TaxID=1416806 RepID=A0A1W6YKF1_9BORD|nr:NAD(P)H-hydrate dehydratase [Bordetella genomosp. 8]ARP81566.1 bifunctional ADP-dependent NAD(P)H-hydrate dehydratase/NAD(P)H-hydrate epimerase [Bordetella genomosp. 8]
MNDDYALLTPQEMAAADQAAMLAGHAGTTLMENAGAAVARAVRARWAPRPVAVLCGPGNNGGDGFVAARYLAAAGWPVTVALLGTVQALKGDAAHHAALWPGDVLPLSPSVLEGAALVIDAIFGAGLARPVDGLAAATLQAAQERGLPVCAVDTPSGVDGGTGAVRGTAVPAACTVTFFRKKPGHLLLPGRALCGELIVADIGIPPSVLETIQPRVHENAPADWLRRFPWPRLDGHKYARGHAVVMGGDVMTGAARLSALAAARIGAGLVTVAAPTPAWTVYAAALTSIMVQPVADEAAFQELLTDSRKNAIAIGPGAGISDLTRAHVQAALATRRAVVLDADALTAFTDKSGTLFHAIRGPCVLTPHEGEFGRLFDRAGDKLASALRAAQRSSAVVLLKGADTVIAAPDGRVAINANAPPDLATGGSGDVLTGMITGLLAQGMEAFDAACAAAWIHGAAATAHGPGLIAEDLPALIPGVLRGLKEAGDPERNARGRPV